MSTTHPSNSQSGARISKPISLNHALPVKAACRACRSRHQKCDGVLPICSRCTKEQKPCDYAPSRRGHSVAHLHGKRRKLETDCPSMLENVLQVRTIRSDEQQSILRNPLSTTALDGASPLADQALAQFPVHIDPQLEDAISIDPLHVAAFYSSFWPSHPFLPPYRHLGQHLKRSGGTDLSSIINYIGFKYHRTKNEHLPAPKQPQRLHQYPLNGFSVQALVLLAITFHMTNDRANAQASLEIAVSITRSIELQQQSFAVNNGRGAHSIEESWRRTWWELLILDVMFAALNQTSNIRLKAVSSDVLLPCEEEIYRDEDVSKFQIRSALHTNLLPGIDITKTSKLGRL